MKQIIIFLVILLSINSFYCFLEKSIADFRFSKNSYKNKQPSSGLGKDLPDQSSYFEGWVHYHHYDSHISKKPRKFFQNNNFFSQRVPLSEIKKKDEHGSLIIPNKVSFYLVVNPTSLQIFSARDNAFKTQTDSLDIHHIKPIPEDNFMKGGLHDLNSSSIGHCFEIKANIANLKKTGNLNQTWVFCHDKKVDKAKLMKIIIKLKLKEQRKHGLLRTEESIKSEKSSNTLSSLLTSMNQKKPENINTGKPLDGYWILLQDWSECTLKCGGGESFQQLQCIPPKNGGKPCQGQSIRVKKCNTQRCPDVKSVLSFRNLIGNEVKKPIIKVAPFSSRLQRYEKCVIKDNDAFLSEIDSKTKVTSKIPIRIVMNNMTISLYKDDDYQDIHHSFELKNTDLMALKNSFCCFMLNDSTTKSTICGYDKYCGNEINNQWASDWSNHFSLFKNTCRVGKTETLLTPEDEKQLADNLKKKIGLARMDIMSKKAKEIRQKILTGGLISKKKIIQVHQTGLAAIQKELQLENLIKNEENQREEEEISAILKKIQKEKDKAACLHRSIKEKKLDAEIINDRRSTENEIREFKEDISNKVEIKRQKLKKLIENMRLKARLRKATLEAELASLRNKMAEEMLKENKIGDMKKCKKGNFERDYRESYCNGNFIDDFVRNTDCKTDYNFCYMCCEREYGNIHIDKREICYNMCDGLDGKKHNDEGKNGKGPWKWNQK